jgi:hypothetical protein
MTVLLIKVLSLNKLSNVKQLPFSLNIFKDLNSFKFSQRLLKIFYESLLPIKKSFRLNEISFFGIKVFKRYSFYLFFIIDYFKQS